MRKGWEVKKLGVICENLDSKRIPITQNKRNKGEYPYYGASGIVDYVADYIFDDDLLLVSEDGANLLARTYPIAFPISGKVWVNNHAHVLKFESSTKQKFVEYYLNSIKLDAFVSGMAQPKLNQAMLNSIPIPIPPHPEQQRIVAILDEALEAINQAKANTEKNLQNARELFQSELNSIFINKGVGWVEKKLKDVTTKIGSGATPLGGEQSYKEKGISLIRSLNVHDDGFRLKNLALIDDVQASKLSNVEVLSGDVLLNITGASVARCTVVPEDVLPARVNQHVSIIRPKKDVLLSRFLHFALTSKIKKAVLLGIGEQGSTRQAITKAQIESFVLTFPPLGEQQRIVNQLDTLSAETKQLEENYRKKLESLEELKKSILHKAFTGELTNKEYKITEQEQLDMVAEK
jgi:type I restriction enzyme S subunit